MNFTFAALNGAKTAFENIIARLKKHKNGKAKTTATAISDLLREFTNALNDDLNTTVALSVLNKAVKMPFSKDIYKLVTKKFDAVLSLSLNNFSEEVKEKTAAIPQEIIELAEKRLTAKSKRDFAAADKLRAEIEQKGYTITDAKKGYEIVRK
jgi:cysteinyl-tRNA synthetase